MADTDLDPAGSDVPSRPDDVQATGDRGSPAAAASLPSTVVHRARVRVLGRPGVDNAAAAGRPIRRAAVELLVYLATHTDGVPAEQILDELWPQTRRRLAAPRLHTAASNLRHILAAAAGADPQQAGRFLHKEHGRYRLNSDVVEVDLWRMRRSFDVAGRSVDPSATARALRQACQAYQGELAAGCDYPWITADREQARRLAVDAPHHAGGPHRCAEPGRGGAAAAAGCRARPVHRGDLPAAMHACHRVGAAAIEQLLHQLTRHLDSIGAEPSPQKHRAGRTAAPRPDSHCRAAVTVSGWLKGRG